MLGPSLISDQWLGVAFLKMGCENRRKQQLDFPFVWKIEWQGTLIDRTSICGIWSITSSNNS